MFSKKQYGLLLLSAMGVFFIIALSIYLLYMGFSTPQIQPQPHTKQHSFEIKEEEIIDEKQAAMTQELSIKANTKVLFEIVDQFGFLTKSDIYNGINWLGYTKVQMNQTFPDYVITKYQEDEVILTRVIERQVEPSYVLTTQKGKIIISIERNGHKIFYKETGLEQLEFSDKLSKLLGKGIPITTEQKDAILEDADEVYMILQEYDE